MAWATFLGQSHSTTVGDARNIYIALTAPIIGALIARAIYAAANSAVFDRCIPPHIYRAPPQHPPEAATELQHCPYPPEALPGGRDVTTPYGRIRAYEWGPEAGRKVLFVHGISTPCIALAPLAAGLVRRHGCRVLLFDLFGRGYSDAADPAVYRQDLALFSAQMLAVTASSSSSSSSRADWRRFTLVGYSLGGGIAAGFTRYFPHLVESLVLIAPGGIIRPERITRGSKLMYSSVLPDMVVRPWVRRLVRDVGFPIMALPKGEYVGATEAAAGRGQHDEVTGGYVWARNSEASMFDSRPGISPATAVAWQVDHHPGFLPAFISSMKYGPIHDGHEHWRLIGQRCEARRTATNGPANDESGLREGKVLVLLGTSDLVILADETAQDVAATLGNENVHILEMPGGHDLPIAETDKCIAAILEFWGHGGTDSLSA